MGVVYVFSLTLCVSGLAQLNPPVSVSINKFNTIPSEIPGLRLAKDSAAGLKINVVNTSSSDIIGQDKSTFRYIKSVDHEIKNKTESASAFLGTSRSNSDDGALQLVAPQFNETSWLLNINYQTSPPANVSEKSGFKNESVRGIFLKKVSDPKAFNPTAGLLPLSYVGPQMSAVRPSSYVVPHVVFPPQRPPIGCSGCTKQPIVNHQPACLKDQHVREFGACIMKKFGLQKVSAQDLNHFRHWLHLRSSRQLIAYIGAELCPIDTPEKFYNVFDCYLSAIPV